MVHRHVSNDEALDPAYAGRFAHAPIPKNRMPDAELLPGAVCRMIHGLLLDGGSPLNMATFVTTWMEPEAEKLMAETFDKKMIDEDEYAQTADVHAQLLPTRDPDRRAVLRLRTRRAVTALGELRSRCAIPPFTSPRRSPRWDRSRSSATAPRSPSSPSK